MNEVPPSGCPLCAADKRRAMIHLVCTRCRADLHYRIGRNYGRIAEVIAEYEQHLLSHGPHCVRTLHEIACMRRNVGLS